MQHKALIVPVLLYGNETKIWKEKEKSRIRLVQIDNRRGLLVLGEWIKCRLHRLGSCAE